MEPSLREIRLKSDINQSEIKCEKLKAAKGLESDFNHNEMKDENLKAAVNLVINFLITRTW